MLDINLARTLSWLQYISELSLMDLNMVKYKSSVIAAGSLCLARLLLRQQDGDTKNENPLWVPLLHIHTRTHARTHARTHTRARCLLFSHPSFELLQVTLLKLFWQLRIEIWSTTPSLRSQNYTSVCKICTGITAKCSTWSSEPCMRNTRNLVLLLNAMLQRSNHSPNCHSINLEGRRDRLTECLGST